MHALQRAKKINLMNSFALSKPSAWLPPAMSLTALAIVLGHVAIFGAAREADEGAAAHLFQLLIVCQVPLVAFFAIRWLPKDPRRAVPILALQIACAVAALAPVFLLHL